MKGQMFLIGAVILVSILFLIRISIRTPTIIEERKVLELTFEEKIFENVENELKKSARYSADDKANITTNVFDFGNFTKDKMNEHGLTFEFLFVGSLANKTTQTINISLVNLLGEPINASLNLNGTTNNSIVSDSQRWDSFFLYTPGLTYVLTVSYNNTYSENVTIKTKANKDVFVGFFDISLKSSDATHKSKSSETYK